MQGCVIQVILLLNKWVGIGIAYELIPLGGGGGITYPKLYTPSTLNIDLILWHTQLIVCAVKC